MWWMLDDEPLVVFLENEDRHDWYSYVVYPSEEYEWVEEDDFETECVVKAINYFELFEKIFLF